MFSISEATFEQVKNHIQKLEAENQLLRDALTKWEEWECDLLNTREAWTEGLPKMTQELFEIYTIIQGIRNEALKEQND